MPHRGRVRRCLRAAVRSASPAGCPLRSRTRSRPQTPQLSPPAQQLERPSVTHPPLDLVEQRVVVDFVKAAANVSVEHPLLATPGDGLSDRLQRVVRRQPGPKPVARGPQSASKIGSSTIFAAVITTLSATHGMPSGLSRPGLPGLGICTRRNGRGRYSPSSASRRARRGTHRPRGAPRRRSIRHRHRARPG